MILACRSQERCSGAKAALDARRLPGSCDCRCLDLNDFASVRRFAEELQRSGGPPLTCLVNNAGVMGVPPGPDGDCAHWRPNHLGPFLLTRLLLPLMAAGGRIVTVASEAHRRGSLRVERAQSSGRRHLVEPRGASTSPLALLGEGGWYGQYARSKLANVLMTAELSRRLQQRASTVTCYAVSPGRVNTGIFANVPGALHAPLRWLAAAAFQSPEQGASTVLQAALAPELQGKHELYLHNMRPCRASAAARDAELAANLWQLSCEQAGLSAADDAALWPPH